jgi:hypothetical protein
MSRTIRRTRLPALVLAGALALAGCSGDTTPTAAKTTPTPTESTSKPEPAPQVWPFTGEKTGRLPHHRAVVVKIENTSSGEPQLGLGSADMVVEELVEGGLTRLAAFYYSSMPKQVGPVRSVRASDIGVAKPARAVLVASGGAPTTMQRLHQAHMHVVSEGDPGYYRVSNRPAPYNLFTNLRKLPASTIKGPRPTAYLPWGQAKGLGRGKPAKHVSAQFSAGSITTWTWNGRYWEHGGGHAAKGDDFRPDNVLALKVRQTSAGYTDPAGNPVPESVFSGKGSATLFHDGRAYHGEWKKKSLTSPLRLVTAKGRQMTVPPGNTWIELIPATSSGDLQFGR